jgi:1,4-alpha-glucan branching enzyme
MENQMTTVQDFSLLTDFDLHLFNQGTHYRLYERMGAHPVAVDGIDGTCFAVWAPNAEQVFLIGDFNEWDKTSCPLKPRGQSGIWEGFVPGVGKGSRYKYHIVSRFHDYRADKADPFAFAAELAPQTASVVWDLEYSWGDVGWMTERRSRNSLKSAMSIYEVHLGSWRRVPEEQQRSLTYSELAQQLMQYVRDVGFTHVELLPVTEHPFYGSWGYQTVAYFAPTSRYGSPQELMRLIDSLHQNGIGVILDWVPSHFPTDEHGIGFFDGTHLYEHHDPRQGVHRDWNTFVHNYGRPEVRNLLISSAFFWLDKYHVDGLRVDAVASMLYLDYSRKEGEWIPNEFGGRENLEAIAFLRTMNQEIYREFPDTQTIAEESTAWPMVSRPVHLGGLGFGLKWDMGWMHDTLGYFRTDPFFRRYHHHELTFRGLYALSENFVLPLSHDEVVYGKGSLLGKMPGDSWQKFANLRLLYGYMYGLPGKKLLFMGGEFGQWREWNHDQSLDWHLLGSPEHQGIQRWVQALNRVHRSEPALHELDCGQGGFEWIDCQDTEKSVLSFLRRSPDPDQTVLVVCSFTPVPRYNYRIGVPLAGFWREILNSDAIDYGGSGHGNFGGLGTVPVAVHGRRYSVTATLPPLGVLFFRFDSRLSGSG